MKNNIKLSRTKLSMLAALIAVIGFSFAACAWSTGGPVEEQGGGIGTGGGTVPSTPTGVTATRNPAGSTTVRVTWNAVSRATSYKVYYSSIGSGSGVLDGTSLTTSFDSVGYSRDLTWYFSVSAVNSAGEGSRSSWVLVGPVSAAGR